jgi:hypothetical protein
MALVLSAATVLAAGLAIVSSTVQNAQANPCSNINIGVGDRIVPSDSITAAGEVNFNCKIHDVEIDADPRIPGPGPFVDE